MSEEIIKNDGMTEVIGIRFKEGGKVYYYEDGVKVGNKTTPDGLLTIDADGVVNYNGAPIKSMTKIYTIIDEA